MVSCCMVRHIPLRMRITIGSEGSHIGFTPPPNPRTALDPCAAISAAVSVPTVSVRQLHMPSRSIDMPVGAERRAQSPKPPSLLHLTRAAAGGRTGFSPRNARRPAAGTAAPACHRPRQSPPWSHPVPSSHSCREMRAPKMNVRPICSCLIYSTDKRSLASHVYLIPVIHRVTKAASSHSCGEKRTDRLTSVTCSMSYTALAKALACTAYLLRDQQRLDTCMMLPSHSSSC